MSNSLAIAAVTATLQSILQRTVVTEADLADTKVTILPLDKARVGLTVNQLNLFLYQISRDAAFSNFERLSPATAQRVMRFWQARVPATAAR